MIDDKAYIDWLGTIDGNFPYTSPSPKPENENECEYIPIILNDIKYDRKIDDSVDESSFIQAREAGFNVCYFGLIPLGDKAAKTLIPLIKNAKKGGLNITISNMYFKTGINGINNVLRNLQSEPELKNYNVRDIIAGIGFADEPTYKDLIGKTVVTTIINENSFTTYNFWSCYKIMMEQSPRLLIINLPGSGEDKYVNGIKVEEGVEGENQIKQRKYEIYLQTFQDFFKPSYFSYDLYPITEISRLIYKGIWHDDPNFGKEEGKLNIGYDQFYADLVTFNRLSLQYNRPFWIYCRTMNFLTIETVNYKPVALEQYIRFALFSGLAYGAKGIQYWTYGMRKNSIDEKSGKTTESYLSALLNRRGQKTASWYYAKKVNEEVQKYREIFLNSRIISVEKTTGQLLNSSGIIYSCTSDDNLDIVISRMEDDTNSYLIIVNGDVLSYQTVSLSIIKGSMTELTPLKSKGTTGAILSTGVNKRILTPGGYRIFRIET